MTYLDELAAAIRAKVDNERVPPDSDHLFLLYALLARAKGPAVTAEDVHDAWAVWMQTRGESHRSVVPFSELDDDTQDEDEPFRAAILAALTRTGGQE